VSDRDVGNSEEYESRVHISCVWNAVISQVDMLSWQRVDG